jgi:hypothetical protein
VYNVNTKGWIAPSKLVEDIEQGKEIPAVYASANLKHATNFRTFTVEVEGIPLEVVLQLVDEIERGTTT